MLKTPIQIVSMPHVGAARPRPPGGSLRLANWPSAMVHGSSQTVVDAAPDHRRPAAGRLPLPLPLSRPTEHRTERLRRALFRTLVLRLACQRTSWRASSSTSRCCRSSAGAGGLHPQLGTPFFDADHRAAGRFVQRYNDHFRFPKRPADVRRRPDRLLPRR